MTSLAPAGVARRHLIEVNIAELLSLGALAALSLEPLLGTRSAAAFVVFGALLLVSNPRHSLTTLVRWWPLLVLPAYCLLSTLWSQFPDNTARHAAQLLFTLCVAMCIAERVSAVQFVRLLFIIFGFGILLSLRMGGTHGTALTGIFGSKNSFAAFVSMFALISVAMAFDTGAWLWARCLAVIGALLCVPLLVLAQSAGALVVTGPAVLAVIAAMGIGRFTGPQKVFLLVAALLAALTIALLIATNGSEILASMLESSGKDSTLTGRTDLWNVGLSIIADHPLLGVGYRAFWMEGYGPAEQLWSMFGEASGAGFNFHDLYISNAVEIGIIGLLIEMVLIYAPAVMLAILALTRPTPTTAFFLGLQTLLIMRSAVEVEVFFEFAIRTVVAYYAVIYSVRELRKLHEGRQAGRRPFVGAAAS